MLGKNNLAYFLGALVLFLSLLPMDAFAHGVDDNTRYFLQNNTGVQFIAFM